MSLVIRWVTASHAEVPAGDAWLGPRERAVLAALAGERRRAEWRLGRWTAKRLLGDPAVEILPAADGAPEAWRGGERLEESVSISHRRGRALAAAAGTPGVGCDLEPVHDGRDAVAHAAWEAAAKALRRGLLDGGRPELDLRERAFTARWPDGARCDGTWWLDGGWVLAVAST